MNSNATYVNIVVTKPVFLKANWITQYYVTIISPTGSPTGSGWYNAGQIATVGVQSTVQYSNGTRQIFTGWNSTALGQYPTAQITVNAPTTLRAAWKTQYLVNVQSQYGTALGSGWYDAGSTVPVSVQSEIDYANATRRMFQGWMGDSASSSPNMTLRVNSPKTLNAQWSTQYKITFKVNGVPNATVLKLNLNSAYYDLSVNRNYQAWYQKGIALNPIMNQTLVDGFMIYKFAGWQNSTGGTIEGPLTVNSPQTYVASYSSEINLPVIPGFPIEAILLGMLLGALVMAFTRRRRKENCQYLEQYAMLIGARSNAYLVGGFVSLPEFYFEVCACLHGPWNNQQRQGDLLRTAECPSSGLTHTQMPYYHSRKGTKR